MSRVLHCAYWAAGILAVLLSPAALVLGVPFTYGIVSDILDNLGALSAALALEVAAAILLWRCLPPHRPTYAAKSMT
jgi:hypothetical protein